MGIFTINSKSLLIVIVTLISIVENGFCQDPFFLTNSQIASYSNPANTGINGSLAFNTVFKTQYLKNSPQFSTAGFALEQSFPCFKKKFDLGLYAISDLEGDGMLNTNEIAFTGVYIVGGGTSNLRMGITTSYVNKRIDQDKLIFSDQLHPERGDVLTTQFQRDDVFSINRLGTSLGIIYLMRSNVRTNREWRLKLGGSFTNFTEIFESTSSESFLKNQYDDFRFLNRITGHADLIYESGKFQGLFDKLFVNPYINTVWQQQLMVTQVGIRFDLNNAIVPGFGFLISNRTSVIEDTKGFICELGYNFHNKSKSDFQINFLYLLDIGGLSNLQGNTLQFGLKYVLNKNGCGEVKGRTSCYSNYGIIYDQFWIE